jgi:nucleoside-diphosphate-sugar epimerase
MIGETMKVLILGVNGFIGNALTKRILDTTDWEVYGLDMSDDKLEHSIGPLPFPRGGHHHQQGVDRVQHQEV